MNSKEILFALQTGKISPDDAEKEIIKLKKALPIQSIRSDVMSNEKPCIVHTMISDTIEGLNQSAKELENQPVVELCEILPGIAQVTMQDRRNKNTFSIELVIGLMQAFETIQMDKKYKAVIITGYDSYFACGGNKEGMQAIHSGKVKLTDVNVYRITLDCRIPVIAAMQGHAIGSGWCMGLFSDFIVMSSESTYTCNHMKYGFTPGDGSTLIFPEKLGANLANEILFLGRKFRGLELEQKGIPIPVMPRKEVLPYAIQLAKNLIEAPRDSLILLKEHITESIKKRLPDIIEKEWAMQEKTFVNEPEVFKGLMSAFDQLPDKPKGQDGQDRLQERFEMLTNVQASYKKSLSNNELRDKQVELNAQKEAKSEPKYPELVHLNRITKGCPIFWIHSDGGGLEGYQAIAHNCKRPFYGIQAHGRMTFQPPLYGIKTIASYYVKLIQSLQPEGPYDLGGHSSGGAIAYEVARQLQELGQEVQTIVMVDTFDEDAMKKVRFSEESKILQAVNMSLVYRIRQEPKKLLSKLIHHSEITPGLSRERLLEYLIAIGTSRGLSTVKTEKELYKIILHNLLVQEAFELDKFKVEPLSDSQSINCFYFRNKSGMSLGEFEPYFLDSGDKVLHSITDYWSGWRRQIPRFSLIDVDATNYMTLLFEPKAYERISELYETKFSEGKLNTKIAMTPVKRKNNSSHISKTKKTISKKNKVTEIKEITDDITDPK